MQGTPVDASNPMTAGSTLLGSTGLPHIGETPHFLRDLHSFVATRIRHYGPVFRTHLLSLPTMISCSYHYTRQLLAVDTAHSTLQAAPAYSEFLGQLYPKPNLLTSGDNSATRNIAATYMSALHGSSLAYYRQNVVAITDQHLARLRAGIQDDRKYVVSIRAYAFFKSLCEQIITTLIVGPLPSELYTRLRQLCSDHFNGVVAVPISLSMFGMRSARARGTHAYRELEVILDRLVAERIAATDGRRECVMDLVVERIRERGEQIDREVRGHIVQFVLLMLSTVIPKCLASALTSALREGGRDAEAGRLLRSAEVESVLMEVLRIWPPLMGGMRKTEGEVTQIGEHVVSGVWRVWYSIFHSNRDESVYEKGEEFQPGRWRGMGSECPFGGIVKEVGSVPIPLTFGAGERMCPGKEIAWMVMCEVLQRFFKGFEVEKAEKSVKMRFFPVLREDEEKDVVVGVRRGVHIENV